MPENSEMIISHPKEYLKLKSNDLDAELAKIRLSEENEGQVRNTHAIKVFHDQVLGKIPVYKLAKTLITWNKEVDHEIKNAKKEILLVNCCNKLTEQGNTIDIIKNFISNPSGNTLFNKIMHIIDDSPPDQELIQHLSNALLYISQSEFENLFNDHKYALSQIQLMTPHSLTILNDSKNWPIFNLGSFQANSGVITSDWLEEFSKTYIQLKKVDSSTRKLVKHCVNELISKRFINAALQGKNQGRVQLTEIGQVVLKYIKG